MRPIVPAIVATALLGLGFLGGHTVATRAVAAPLREQQEELARLRSSVETLGRAVSLLSVIPLAPARPEPTDTAPLAPKPPLPTAEQAPRAEEAPLPARKQDEARLGQAIAMLDEATQRGQWTRRDEDLLRQLRIESPDTDWVPFMQQLGAALNDGKLRPPPMEVDGDR